RVLPKNAAIGGGDGQQFANGWAGQIQRLFAGLHVSRRAPVRAPVLPPHIRPERVEQFVILRLGFAPKLATGLSVETGEITSVAENENAPGLEAGCAAIERLSLLVLPENLFGFRINGHERAPETPRLLGLIEAGRQRVPRPTVPFA